MRTNIQDLISATKSLCEQLEELHVEVGDVSSKSAKAANLIRKVLTSFRKQISQNGFHKEEDEIHFFKYVKPRVNSYLIFFSILDEIETERIIINEREISDVIDKKQRMFRYIMRENREFVSYYRAG